ncbi:MAG: type I glyceraldehyde-3-phosphate dehydrogenase [Candidatus Zixiibacteriota bacterium]|nr:MAG: type I glyceraldehyde-3-phosphate dehydrogenase [candidate division Zixibacteria bacterium]
MSIKVGINGFGRIGRLVFRAAFKEPDIEVVGVNDITDAKTLAHLLKYDSIHGQFPEDVIVGDNSFTVGDRIVKVMAERDPGNLPWDVIGAEVVLECTGLFRDKEKASKHISAGAKKVLISAPAKNHDGTFVKGVNFDQYDASKHQVVSIGSCTTNCLAPVVKVLHDNFKIKYGFMTTIHSYTNDQRILDLPHKDLRRARSAAMSMIPTTTGAAKAISEVIPEMKGRLDGLAVRVPTPDGSLVDLVVETERKTSKEEVNAVMKKAAEGFMKGVLRYTEAPIVSVDVIGDPHSSIFDALSTMVIQENFIKVLSWYDNEWGFSCRMVDMIKLLGG